MDKLGEWNSASSLAPINRAKGMPNALHDWYDSEDGESEEDCPSLPLPFLVLQPHDGILLRMSIPSFQCNLTVQEDVVRQMLDVAALTFWVLIFGTSNLPNFQEATSNSKQHIALRTNSQRQRASMEMIFTSQISDGCLKLPKFYGSKCYPHYRHWSTPNRLIGGC